MGRVTRFTQDPLEIIGKIPAKGQIQPFTAIANILVATGPGAAAGQARTKVIQATGPAAGERGPVCRSDGERRTAVRVISEIRQQFYVSPWGVKNQTCGVRVEIGIANTEVHFQIIESEFRGA